jgi:ribosomal protein S18 acetylase RimI-like enzyme
MLKKVIFTLINLREVSRHHYGDGCFSIVKFVFYSLLKVNTFIVFECDMSRSLPPSRLDAKFRVIKPTFEELHALRHGKDLPREFYADKFHQVKTCYLALWGNEIAYIHWVYRQGDYSRFVKLREDVCEINYITTLPKFRGYKLSSHMLAITCRDFQELGYKKGLVIVHENTTALIKNLQETDFVERGRIRTLGPFNRKIVA